jgi:NAD-dependent dihydropyrimidine dehydrogenase PreA subunit
MPCPRYVESNIQLLFLFFFSCFCFENLQDCYFTTYQKKIAILHIAGFTSFHRIYIHIYACIECGICEFRFIVSSSM